MDFRNFQDKVRNSMKRNKIGFKNTLKKILKLGGDFLKALVEAIRYSPSLIFAVVILLLFTFTVVTYDPPKHSEGKNKTDELLQNETNGIIDGKEYNKIEIKKPEMTDLETQHVIIFKGQEICFTPIYSIEKKKADNWLFTQPSTINLSFGVKEIPEGLRLMVSQVYADISLLSKQAKFNGIRQDSINIEYFSLPTGGVCIDQSEGYIMPFKIEAVDKSETFFNMFYGFGSSRTSRIEESDLVGVQGVVLNVVWTISLETPDGSLYIKTIEDKIGIPAKKANEKESNTGSLKELIKAFSES